MNFEVTKIVGHENFFENPKLNIQKQTSFQPSVIVSVTVNPTYRKIPLMSTIAPSLDQMLVLALEYTQK